MSLYSERRFKAFLLELLAWYSVCPSDCAAYIIFTRSGTGITTAHTVLLQIRVFQNVYAAVLQTAFRVQPVRLSVCLWYIVQAPNLRTERRNQN